MPKSANQKLKLFYLLELLREQSDETHRVSMQQICDSMERNGIKAERKSIYADIEALQQLGYDVEYQSTGLRGYYLGNREFELAELKLLVDAVQASKFVTEKQTNTLIGKLEKFTSRYEASKLQRQVRVHDQIKSENMSTLYLIDDIHQAIHSNHTITFLYYEWNLQKKLVPRHNGERYEVSPWALLWEDENYYLVAYDNKSGTVKFYRVDKMKQIEMQEKERQGVEEFKKFDVAQFSRKTFGMFAGEEKSLTLQFDKSLIGVAIDRFGREVSLIKNDSDSFYVMVRVHVSNQFYGWLTALGSGVRIVEPTEEAEKYRNYIKKIIEL